MSITDTDYVGDAPSAVVLMIVTGGLAGLMVGVSAGFALSGLAAMYMLGGTLGLALEILRVTFRKD